VLSGSLRWPDLSRLRSRLQAKEAIVVVVGARPIEYQKRIVRDRHSGKLAEIDLHEFPPWMRATRARPLPSSAGRRCEQTHPAVAACPNAFIPVADRAGE
jgi:hypothetical protein